MTQERLPMRKIREILRLRHEFTLSIREVARSVRAGKATVSDTLARAREAGLSWPLVPDLDEAGLNALLYGPQGSAESLRSAPDWARVHEELRKKHVTLALVWEEYRAEQPGGYRYSQFCNLYREWR